MASVLRKGAILGVVAAAAAWGLPIQVGFAEHAQDRTLAIDTAEPLALSSPASGIIVGNPSIVGVSVQSDRLVFLTGRAYGTTSVTILGADGRSLYHGRITVTPDESGSVMVTRGTETARLTCAPVCRPQPDIGDAAGAFSQATQQAQARASAAAGQ